MLLVSSHGIILTVPPRFDQQFYNVSRLIADTNKLLQEIFITVTGVDNHINRIQMFETSIPQQKDRRLSKYFIQVTVTGAEYSRAEDDNAFWNSQDAPQVKHTRVREAYTREVLRGLMRVVWGETTFKDLLKEFPAVYAGIKPRNLSQKLKFLTH